MGMISHEVAQQLAEQMRDSYERQLKGVPVARRRVRTATRLLASLVLVDCDKNRFARSQIRAALCDAGRLLK
jgi:hypothetical protein